jgi:predicted amidophosphoribosyltransferase
LSQWQRQANIDSSFHLLHPERIHDRHLLLVDDIVTTGTTVATLAQTLQQAGGVRFSVVALGFTKSK